MSCLAPVVDINLSYAGNFFMWDKRTGKLVDILEGDGSIVNVVHITYCGFANVIKFSVQIEQHPSLPILSVSGLDHTVKVPVFLFISSEILTTLS